MANEGKSIEEQIDGVFTVLENRLAAAGLFIFQIVGTYFAYCISVVYFCFTYVHKITSLINDKYIGDSGFLRLQETGYRQSAAFPRGGLGKRTRHTTTSFM